MGKDKAIIYGLGEKYRSKYFNTYIKPEIKKKYCVVGVSDTDFNKWSAEIPYRFIEKSDIHNQCDVVIVTSMKYYDDICKNLFVLGVKNVISLNEIEDEIISRKIACECFSGLHGVEVGGPSDIFRPIYKSVSNCNGINFNRKTVWWESSDIEYTYQGIRLGNIIIADATNLSCLSDNSYEFYISSNNLEHIANPMLAIYEAVRVLKDLGLILIVVPCKDYCFDHNRKYTSFEHIKEDYLNGTDEHDLSHLDEILQLHDISMDDGVESLEVLKKRALSNYDNRCLHHHVFNENTLKSIFKYFDIEIINYGRVINNYFILGRVNKNIK